MSLFDFLNPTVNDGTGSWAPVPPADIPSAPSAPPASPIDQAFDQGNSPTSFDVNPSERDLAIRTLYGEAGGEGPGGQAAVAHVIKNRLMSGNYGSSIDKVITAPKQFSMWNPGDPVGDKARALDPNSETYKNLGNIVDGVFGGTIKDPTGGADHYYNPNSATPAWGDKLAKLNDVTIGNHRFVGTIGNKGKQPQMGVDDTSGLLTPASYSPGQSPMIQAMASGPGTGYDSLTPAQKAKIAATKVTPGNALPVSLANPSPTAVQNANPRQALNDLLYNPNPQGGQAPSRFGPVPPGGYKPPPIVPQGPGLSDAEITKAATAIPAMTQALNGPQPPVDPNGPGRDVNGNPTLQPVPTPAATPAGLPPGGPMPGTRAAPLPPPVNVAKPPIVAPPVHQAFANPNPARVAPRVAAPPAQAAPQSPWGNFMSPDSYSNGMRPFNFGDALTKAGIALMARDNPQGASAMAQIPMMEARSYQPKFSNVAFNGWTGQGVTFNNRTGTYGVNSPGNGGGNGNGANSGGDGYQPVVPLSDSARKEFGDNNEHINQEAGVNIPKLREIQEQLRTKQIDPNYLSQTAANLRMMADSGDTKAQNLIQAQHWMALYHNDILKSHPGQQTDKDSEEAWKTILPGTSEYDSKAWAHAIDNIITSSRQRLNSMIQEQNGAIHTYGKQIPFDTQERAQTYQNYQKQLDAGDAAWGKVSAPWFAQPSVTAPPPRAEPKFSGSHSATGGEGSIPTLSPADAAKAAPGTFFRTQDGRVIQRGH